jgi:phospholipase D-like protein
VAKTKWSDLSTLQKRTIVVGGVLEAVTTIAALRDLAKRPADQVRGPKAVWVLSFVVQPLGPLAYFAVARR